MKFLTLCITLLLIIISHSALAEEKAPKKPMIFEFSAVLDAAYIKPIISAYQKAFENLGYDFQLRVVPGKRGFAELKRGAVDGSLAHASDLNEILGGDDFVRIDFPISIFHGAFWCRPPSWLKAQSQPEFNIRIGYLLGQASPARLLAKADRKTLEVATFQSYAGGMAMLKKGNIDCLLSAEALLEANGINPSDLESYRAIYVIDLPIYSWISKRYSQLKPAIEKELSLYPFDPAWDKKYRSRGTTCQAELNIICPDGVIFNK